MPVNSLGLYYPYMHFRDETWLKAAALYWDQINRIVPSTMQGRTDDSPVVERLKGELGFIYDIAPEMETWQVGPLFLEALLRVQEEVVSMFSLTGREAWPIDTVLRSVQNVQIPEDFDPRLAYVQTGKMSGDLVKFLVESGLAIYLEQFEFDKDWLGMHPRLADVYMTALAKAVAANSAMEPLTEGELNHAAIMELSVGGIMAALLGVTSPESEEARTLTAEDLKRLYLEMAFSIVLPKDLSGVPVERIIDLRKGAFTGAYRAFQARIKEMITSEEARGLQEIENQDAQQAHIANEFNKHLLEPLEELERSIGSLTGSTVPTVLNVVVQLVQVSAKGAVAVGAKALGLIPAIAKKQEKAKETLKRSPVAYLLHIKEGLQPATSLQRMKRFVRKFTYGI